MSHARFLILGATGNVGGATAQALLSQGLDVLAATRDPSKGGLPAGARPVKLDLSDPSTWDAALDGVTHLYAMSVPGVVDAFGYVGPFLRRALRTVSRVVLMTADGVQYDDTIPLRRLELLVEGSGVGYALLRPNWFMQNFHTFWWPAVQATGNILLPAADSRSAFVDTRDIGAAAAAALTAAAAPNRAYTITGPESLTYAEAAAILSAETGRAIGYQDIPPEAFAASLTQAGLPADYVAMLTNMFAFVRQGSAATVSGDLQALTGQPPRALAQFARDHKAAYAA